MVEFDDDIFAAGNCFDWNQHPKKKGLFCPFAFRLPYPNHGASLAKDLAAEYHYLGNTSEWFFLARKNAERVIAKNEQYITGMYIFFSLIYFCYLPCTIKYQIIINDTLFQFVNNLLSITSTHHIHYPTTN